jgi:hypothetical protein
MASGSVGRSDGGVALHGGLHAGRDPVEEMQQAVLVSGLVTAADVPALSHCGARRTAATGSTCALRLITGAG